jgi:glycerol kinase
MDGFVLSIDQGTSATKACIFDHGGRIVATSSHAVPRYYPQEGWVEEDPEEMWRSVLLAVGDALKDARILPEDLQALGISNQQCTTVVWNRRTGEPIGRAIVWQDCRTLSICERFTARELDEAGRRTGCRPIPNLSSVKLRWLLENDRAVQKALANGELLFGTVDSWLVWKLTGGAGASAAGAANGAGTAGAAVHVTDVSNASNTGMLNTESLDWDEAMLAKLDIPRSILPAIRSSSEVYGHTKPEVFFGASVPIAACVGDQGAAAFGQACIGPGMMKNTYGTGAFMTRSTGKLRLLPEGGLGSTATWALGGSAYYCVESFANVSGEVIDWLATNLGFMRDAGEADGLAIQVPDSGGVYFVPSMAGLQTPIWKPRARGTIWGLGFGSTKQHITRAALEAMAYQTRDSLERLESTYGFKAESLRVDGGSTRSDFLMQFQADILGIPIERPVVTEASSLGAAYLAGLAIGYWGSVDEAVSNWRLDTRFEPRLGASRRDELYSGWLEAVELAGGWKERRPGPAPKPQKDGRLEALSPREKEVMRHFVAGRSMREVSVLLRTSIKTVEKQRRDAMAKLGADNLATAVRICLELGLAARE